MTKYAELKKDSVKTVFTAENSVEITSTAKVIDNGDKGIQNIKALVYVPQDGELELGSLGLRVFDESKNLWTVLQKDIDFTVVYRGITDFEGRGQYSEYLIEKKSGSELYETGINLYNKDKLEVKYEVSLPYGTSFLVTRVSGYNYYEDKIIFEDIEIPIRRELDEGLLTINEYNWFQGSAVVGRPVPMKKIIEIFNPGSLPVEYKFTTEVFEDTISSYVYDGDYKERLTISRDRFVSVSFVARVGPGETKNYTLVANTPPVIEINRNLTSKKLNEVDVEFLYTSLVKNFAEENYQNVSFIFPIEKEKIVSVTTDSLPVTYTESTRGITIDIPYMKTGSSLTLFIDFITKLPLLITTSDNLQYECSGIAYLNITVIPSENETNSYIETEVIGPQPVMNTRYLNIRKLDSIEPWQDIQIPMEIDISNFPDGVYYVRTTMKKDFIKLASDEIEFTVECPIRNIMLNSNLILLIIIPLAIIIIVYVIVRVRRKRFIQRGIGDLRERLRELGV